jgi:hypothetical protein
MKSIGISWLRRVRKVCCDRKWGSATASGMMATASANSANDIPPWNKRPYGSNIRLTPSAKFSGLLLESFRCSRRRAGPMGFGRTRTSSDQRSVGARRWWSPNRCAWRRRGVRGDRNRSGTHCHRATPRPGCPRMQLPDWNTQPSGSAHRRPRCTGRTMATWSVVASSARNSHLERRLLTALDDARYLTRTRSDATGPADGHMSSSPVPGGVEFELEPATWPPRRAAQMPNPPTRAAVLHSGAMSSLPGPAYRTPPDGVNAA